MYPYSSSTVKGKYASIIQHRQSYRPSDKLVSSHRCVRRSEADVELDKLRAGSDYIPIKSYMSLNGRESASSQISKNENIGCSIFNQRETAVRQESDTQHLSEMVKVMNSMIVDKTIRGGYGMKTRSSYNISEVDDVDYDYIANYTFREPSSDGMTKCNKSSFALDPLFLIKSSSEPPVKLITSITSIAEPLANKEMTRTPSPPLPSATAPIVSRVFGRDIYSPPSSKAFEITPPPSLLTTSGSSLRIGTIKGKTGTMHSRESSTVLKRLSQSTHELPIQDLKTTSRGVTTTTRKPGPVLHIATTLTCAGSIAFCPHCRVCVDVVGTMKVQNVRGKDEIVCPKCQNRWKDEEAEKLLQEIEIKEAEEFRQAVLEWRNGKFKMDLVNDAEEKIATPSAVPSWTSSSTMKIQVPKMLYFSHLMKCCQESDDWIV
eukprot:Tbor_TRINITY_DN4500_c0_g1::TRINITY_DN4500_c0_g1_i1::g.15732::m.15732